MPKAGFAIADGYDLQLGIQEGPVEVLGAVCRIHQYPPNRETGIQGNPFPCVQLEFAKLDPQGNRLPDEDPVKMEFGLGNIEKFHPGQCKGADDPDPEDLGTEIDTEGNTIYTDAADNKINNVTKWMMFAASLEHKGFDRHSLHAAYLPDLIGLKIQVKTEAVEKRAGMTYKREPTSLVVEKIIALPAKQRGKKPVAVPPKADKANGAPAPAPAGPVAVPAAASADEAAELIATQTMAEVAAENKGKTVERKKLQTSFQARLMRNKVPIKHHKQAMDLIKSADWLNQQATDDETSPLFGLLMADDASVVFAE